MVPSKEEVAKKLAEKHYEIEEGITQIFRITRPGFVEGASSEPIRLLEVNVHTIPTGIMPLYFGPNPASGFPFPSVIVEVTPDELEQIKSHELQLHDGWALGEELARPQPKDGRV